MTAEGLIISAACAELCAERVRDWVSRRESLFNLWVKVFRRTTSGYSEISYTPDWFNTTGGRL